MDDVSENNAYVEEVNEVLAGAGISEADIEAELERIEEEEALKVSIAITLSNHHIMDEYLSLKQVKSKPHKIKCKRKRFSNYHRIFPLKSDSDFVKFKLKFKIRKK
jgi:hypothetical protein